MAQPDVLGGCLPVKIGATRFVGRGDGTGAAGLQAISMWTGRARMCQGARLTCHVRRNSGAFASAAW